MQFLNCLCLQNRGLAKTQTQEEGTDGKVCRVCRVDAHRSGSGSDASGPGYIMRAHGPSADMVLQCDGLIWAEFRRYEGTVAPDAAWLLLEGLAFVTIS